MMARMIVRPALRGLARSALSQPRAMAPLSSALRSCATAATKAPGEAEFVTGFELLEQSRLSPAVDSFARSAELGHAEGNFYLGLAYDGLIGTDSTDSHPIELDPAAAARCYERAAQKGHSMAMLNLSLNYKNGDGVEADVGVAWKWLSLAAAADDCDRACFNAGVALDPLHPPYGRPGVDMIGKDPEKALFFYRKAVAQGHEKAKVNLGVALYTGTGCAKDKAAAEKLWLEAHEAGVTEAGFCLRNMEDSPGKLEQMFNSEA